MKLKRIICWLVVVIALLMALWCYFPVRYSSRCSEAFALVNEKDRQRLMQLLLTDYEQMALQDTQICYMIDYDRVPVSVWRLWEDATTGRHMKSAVSMQAEILECLFAMNGFGGLVPEVELIYVSPEYVRFGTHMCIRELFWQRNGVPLNFFRDEGNKDYRLYWLDKDWYYAYSIAK